jgi:hypothetical protein
MVGAMSAYVTMLSMPLVGMTAEDVLIEVSKALAGDGRVERVDRVDTVHVGSRPDEHVSVAVRFDAAPQGAAHQLAGELHGRALRAVLAVAPAERGWTSDFAPPGLAPD